MFELATTGHWWEIAKKYPILSDHPNVLKPLGYAHIINLIEAFKPKRILEIGHGGFSFVFEIFYDKIEMWGLDDLLDNSSVSKDDLNRIRKDYPDVKFVEGLMGKNIKELPENYFDLVYSVSVIEHVPDESLKDFFDETYRILKEGGIVSHSFDVYFNQNTKSVYDAYENSGFEWIKSKDTMNVFWEKWLGEISTENLTALFENIITENPMQIAEVYMWEQERTKRHPPVNYFTILTAAKKPLKKDKDAGKKLVLDSNILYSKKSHFEIFNKNNFSKELTGKDTYPSYCDIKLYQSLLVYSFIGQYIPKGAKILEIGNINLQIMKKLMIDYECWNISKEENQLINKESNDHIKFIHDEIGNLNSELVPEYFDFVFSISSFEERKDDPEKYRNILTDINRVMKQNAYSLQCILVLLKNSSGWSPGILDYFLENQKMSGSVIPYSQLELDPDFFTMTEKFYSDNWKKFTGIPFIKFGKPFSYNLLWKKS